MKIFLRAGATIILTSFLTIFLGCASHDDPIPTQSQTEQSWVMTAANNAETEMGQKWFAEASKQTSHPVEINWQQAQTNGHWIVAPVIEPSKFFANIPQQGLRFLAVQIQNNGIRTGSIIELLLPTKSLTPEQAISIAATGVQSVVGVGMPAQRLSGFTGAMFIYSPLYKHQVGLQYQDGVLQQGRLHLKTEITTTTKSDKSDSGNNTAAMKTNLLAVTTCEVISVTVTCIVP